jgi:hypothetical protein
MTAPAWKLAPVELAAFVKESNRIEGILREPSQAELDATAMFLALPKITVDDVQKLVSVYQPGAKLRSKPGMNVRVGNHITPQGGPLIASALTLLLESAETDDPHRVHLAYEKLHPFIDGNGRSGRAIWAWQMIRQQQSALALGFLHRFYYQTLAAASEPPQEGWRDIASAPKDGTAVLIAQIVPADARRWSVLEGHYVSRRDGPDTWYGANDYGDEEFSQPYEPTHWQPLPPPPTRSGR